MRTEEGQELTTDGAGSTTTARELQSPKNKDESEGKKNHQKGGLTDLKSRKEKEAAAF